MLGRSERREIRSRLLVLLHHLLKWKVQPERCTNLWTASLVEERHRIGDVLTDSPSLKTYPESVLAAEYRIARLKAAGDLDLPEDSLPELCPFSIEQVLSPDFWPAG